LLYGKSRIASGGNGGTIVETKTKPKGWYLKEKRKELGLQIRIAKKWIEQCTDPDRLADLQEHLWRLEYREIFLGKKK
jgi:hypothetical protein